MGAAIAGLALAAALLGGTTGTVQEDSPYWNCLTMGNHVCGPTAAPRALAALAADAGRSVA